MLFDSDVIIWFLRRESAAVKLINHAQNRSISIITLMEVMQGARSKKETKTILALFAQTGFRTLPLSESIGHVAAGLIEQHALSHGIQLADALIAAAAMENELTLVSANVKHFRPIRGLRLQAFRPQAR